MISREKDFVKSLRSLKSGCPSRGIFNIKALTKCNDKLKRNEITLEKSENSLLSWPWSCNLIASLKKCKRHFYFNNSVE